MNCSNHSALSKTLGGGGGEGGGGGWYRQNVNRALRGVKHEIKTNSVHVFTFNIEAPFNIIKISTGF